MNRLACLAIAPALLSLASSAAAQEGEPPPIFTAGFSAATMHFKGRLSQDVLTGLLQLQPRPWLTVGTAPSAVRVSPPDSAASSGFGDLPVWLGLTHLFGGTASPALGAVLELSLPTGTGTGGIGSRDVGWAVDLGAGFAPSPRSYLFVNAGRDLTPARGSFVRSVQSTSLGADASFDLSSRLRGAVTLAADVGRSDSIAPLTRTAGVGLSVRLAGGLRFVADGGLGLNEQSPQWLVSVSLGTAFSGLSPVGLNNPVERVKKAFGRGSAKVRGSRVRKGPG